MGADKMTAQLDSITGPLPREKLKELIAAPHGQARKIIQKYDPEWGRTPGEKFEWKIIVRRSGADQGTAYIKAASKEEADKLADDLTEAEVDWDYDSIDFEILSVEPNKCG